MYSLKIKSLLLQASAGSDETYAAKIIANKLGKERVKITAPTNKAALKIRGHTIQIYSR
jgi:hypothetical protein